jgi:hypothetical protein
MKKTAADRTHYLQNSAELDTIYRNAALSGSSEPPAPESDFEDIAALFRQRVFIVFHGTSVYWPRSISIQFVELITCRIQQNWIQSIAMPH